MSILDLKKFFGNLNFPDFFTSIGSGYGRRFAEPYYDKIAEMPFFQKLKQKGMPAKIAMEALSNAVAAFLDQKIDDASPMRKLIKEIFMDSSSELNKRLMNGEPPKKILVENVERITDSKEKDFLAILLMMDEEKLKPFLEELAQMTDQERCDSIQKMRGLSTEDLLKYAHLSPETRNLISKITQPPEKKSVLTAAQKDIEEGLDFFAEEMARRRAIKKGGIP